MRDKIPWGRYGAVIPLTRNDGYDEKAHAQPEQLKLPGYRGRYVYCLRSCMLLQIKNLFLNI